MESALGATIFLCSLVFGILCAFFMLPPFFGIKLDKEYKKEFAESMVGYDDWKKKHDEHLTINRERNKRYTYDEKYKDFKYQQFKLQHLNETNKPDFYVGTFEGTAECVCAQDNTYGYHFPIVVYDGEHNLIGYLPDNNQSIYDYIKENNGQVRAYGYITKKEHNEAYRKYYRDIHLAEYKCVANVQIG